MIVWGGQNNSSYLNTGGRYDPATDCWIATNAISAPDARYIHTAVWTGSQMIVWGGSNYISSFNTGGRYDPTTDSWTATQHNQRACRASVSHCSLDWHSDDYLGRN
jgi:hypothetical protein